MESVRNGIRKESLKEVRKKLGILPDDLRNFLSFLSTLRLLHSHQGNSLVMGPQASCLVLNPASHVVLALLFLAPKLTMAPHCVHNPVWLISQTH